MISGFLAFHNFICYDAGDLPGKTFQVFSAIIKATRKAPFFEA